MGSDDIRTIQRHEHEQNSTQTCITLQNLKRPEHYDLCMLMKLECISDPKAALSGAHVDILCQGTGTPLPSTIIMDFIYGVACYRLWSSRHGQGDIHEVMATYHEAHYKIPTHPPNQPMPTLQGKKTNLSKKGQLGCAD